MNWAAWEYQIQCANRLTQWRKAGGVKVEGSRVMLYDTRPRSPYFATDGIEKMQHYTYKYGGARTYRMTSHVTMTEIMARQQEIMNRVAKRWAEEISHVTDAMIYGTIMHKTAMIKTKKHNWALMDYIDPWEKPQVKHEFYERARAWQSNLTVSGPSLSDMLSPGPPCSRSEGNKSKHGWLSRMPK